jgi:FkbM family methyltransferase
MFDWIVPRRHSRESDAQKAMAHSDRANDDDIRYAYRLLLGREPDDAGLAHFRRVLADRQPTADDLAREFLVSPEFLARNVGLPVEVPMDGYSVFINPLDHDIGQSVRDRRQYEPHVTAVVRECLHEGNVFVDVGANIGYFTLLAAHLVGAAGRVVAIEPMDKNVQLIYLAAQKNGFEQIRLHQCAASDRRGLLAIATGAGTSNGQALHASAQAGWHGLMTQSCLLDDLVADLPRIDLVKLDIEGFELLAWRGFRGALARHRPRVLTEFHPHCMRTFAGVDPLDYLSELFAYGQRISVLALDDERVLCADAGEVMQQWAIGDRRARGDGTNHLDLLIEPDRD